MPYSRRLAPGRPAMDELHKNDETERALRSRRRRLRSLWIGLFVYLFIFTGNIAMISHVPYQYLVLAAAVNVAVVSVFIVAIRRLYTEKAK